MDSTSMFFWSGRWAPPGIGVLGIPHQEALRPAPASQVLLLTCGPKPIGGAPLENQTNRIGCEAVTAIFIPGASWLIDTKRPPFQSGMSSAANFASYHLARSGNCIRFCTGHMAGWCL